MGYIYLKSKSLEQKTQSQFFQDRKESLDLRTYS